MAMTRDDIIRMAHEAGFDVVGDLYGENTIIAKLTKLVELEREACAKVCDEYDVAEDVNSCDTAEGIALAIRARGQHD